MERYWYMIISQGAYFIHISLVYRLGPFLSQDPIWGIIFSHRAFSGSVDWQFLRFSLFLFNLDRCAEYCPSVWVCLMPFSWLDSGGLREKDRRGAALLSSRLPRVRAVCVACRSWRPPRSPGPGVSVRFLLVPPPHACLGGSQCTAHTSGAENMLHYLKDKGST